MKRVSFSIIIVTILMVLSSCQKKSSEKEILSFRFVSPNVEASIDGENIVAEVPFGTDVSALVPTIIISEGASIDPASGMATDFTNPVTYTVTAEDGSQAKYLVAIMVEKAEHVFIGTWGVEKIDYYNTDYAGNPISYTLDTYTYDPNDIDNGIQLVFGEDNVGEMRDSSIDTIWIDWNPETFTYDSFIVCPDTTVVTAFTYSFASESFILNMNMEDGRAFTLQIVELSADAFVYENEYAQNYVEKAYLRRLSYEHDHSYLRHYVNQDRPYREGPLLRRR